MLSEALWENRPETIFQNLHATPSTCMSFTFYRINEIVTSIRTFSSVTLIHFSRDFLKDA